MWQRTVMKCGRGGGLGDADIVLNYETLKQVTKFRYLGEDIDEVVPQNRKVATIWEALRRYDKRESFACAGENRYF